MPDREIDLEIVSASWQSLTDTEGYDRMMEAWDRKLAHAARSPGLLDRILSRQLHAIDDLLSSDMDIKVEDPIEAAVRETPAPAMVLSPDGRVITTGGGGEHWFGVKQGALAGTEWLRDDSRGNYDAVRRTAGGRGNAAYAIVRTVSENGAEQLAEVYALTVRGHDRGYTVVRSLELEWYPEVSANLSQAFGLTDAETEICKLLFRLRETPLIADERGAQAEMVRTQLKRIYAKVEVGSKVDLVRMLGLLCARAALNRETRSMHYADPLGRETILHRADRRRLAYTWCGAEHGAPILFVHGEIPYFALPESTRAMLRARGLKLICLSMPGHGNSDPDPSREQIDDGVAAIAEFCDRLGLRGFGAFASYSGQFPLTRTAARHPHLFSGVMVLGFPWNLCETRFKAMPLAQRTLAGLARRAPVAFELVIRLALRRMLEEGPDFYLSRAFDGTPIDLAAIHDPEMQAPLRSGCRHLANQGHHAFVREQLMVAHNHLPDWFGDIECPVHYLLPPDLGRFRREDYEALKALGPTVTVEQVPDAGELLPYQRPELFVERLADLTGEAPGRVFAARDSGVAAA